MRFPGNSRLKILVTNDDGVNADGLWTLVDWLKDVGRCDGRCARPRAERRGHVHQLSSSHTHDQDTREDTRHRDVLGRGHARRLRHHGHQGGHEGRHRPGGIRHQPGPQLRLRRIPVGHGGRRPAGLLLLHPLDRRLHERLRAAANSRPGRAWPGRSPTMSGRKDQGQDAVQCECARPGPARYTRGWT